jgi:lysophospholipase L1-like esterase
MLSRITTGCAFIAAFGMCLGLARPAAAQVSAPPAPRRALPEPANPALPTLFLIGDSTVRNGQGDGAGGQWGWGEPIAAYFDTTKINVVNRAVGGLSSRTYLTGGHWERVLALVKPGDFVVMQFGHNDEGPVNDDFRARGTIKGTGEETEDIDNLITHKQEIVHTYGWYLRTFIADAKARGVTPIVCSLVPRKIWKDGKIARNSANYAKWAGDVATAEHVAFVNLNEIIAAKYDRLGPANVEALFADPHTHTSQAGAELNAASAVEGLQALHPNPLAAYFSAKARQVGAAAVTQPKTSFKFDFGPGLVAPGYLQVLAPTIYSSERGYGFEPGATITCVDRGGKDPLRSHFCTSDTPFYFSVALPEGNYKVTVTFGDRNGETVTTVKAELRRLMVERVHTARGKFETRTFVVNIRTPQISGGGEVRLKDREKTTEMWAWDEKLTLEFNDAHPAVDAIEIARADGVPTIYLLGDSTVCDQPREPFNSWGQMLPRFFKPDVAIANHAESGESLRSSLAARRLDKVLTTMKPGDYLIIQYGHNDEKERGEGVGAFTTYKADLKQFVDQARKRGAVPVLVTPMHRRTFGQDGTIINSHGDYPEAVRQVASEENVPLIDLHAMSKLFYEALGPEKSSVAFKSGDATHHNNYGSYELAKCIIEGMRATKLGLVKYLMKDVPRFDPAHPDPPDGFTLPSSPLSTEVTPL